MKAQQTFEGGSIISDAQFFPRVCTLSSPLQTNFFSFHPINIYLVHITYRKGMYTSHSMHEEEE